MNEKHNQKDYQHNPLFFMHIEVIGSGVTGDTVPLLSHLLGLLSFGAACIAVFHKLLRFNLLKYLFIDYP